MLGKYTKIDYVKYEDGTTAYLITGEEAASNGFEVDIVSDCDFNTEYTVVERKTACIINNVHDIINFAKNLNTDLSSKYNGAYLLVGGSNDCAILDDLEYDWVANLEIIVPDLIVSEEEAKLIDELILKAKRTKYGLITNWDAPYGISFDELVLIGDRMKYGEEFVRKRECEKARRRLEKEY